MNIKKIFAFTSFTLVTLLSVTSCANKNEVLSPKNDDYFAQLKQLSVSTGDKVYSTKQHYVYKLEKPLDRSPDTFESWIKVSPSSEGGMIAGNYMFAIGTTSDVTVDWGVDVTGGFRVVWGCKGLDYVFPEGKVNDGLWHHVALTRNPSTHVFSYYLDGVLKGTTMSRQKDAVEPSPMVFGSDNRSWTIVAEPFNGDIKDITMYNATLSAADILEDYERGSSYNTKYTSECLGSWNLGEKWTQKTIKPAGSNNKAYLASQDKFVPMVETPDYDYTILGMPDIQTMVDFPQPLDTWEDNSPYLPMMQWVRDNYEKEKIKFAVQVGDLVDDGADEPSFLRAKQGYQLWENKIPYSTVPGNHDYTDNCLTKPTASRDLTLYNKHFGTKQASRFKEFGGTFEGGIENSYYLLDIGEVKYMIINLEFFPRMKVIRWAGRLCEQYPDRRVIVNTHYCNDYYGRIFNEKSGWGPANYPTFDSDGVTIGTDLYEGLIKKYKNIFMTMSGHVISEDAVVTKSIGDNGNPIINILIDVQCNNHWGGITWSIDPLDPMLFMKFNEEKKEIYCRYYSVEEDAVYNVQNQFTLSFADWQEPLEANYR